MSGIKPAVRRLRYKLGMRIWIALLTLTLAACAGAPAAAPAEGFATAVARSAPAAVGVYALRANQARATIGAGFLIDADGYLVTSAHVVERSDDIAVMLYDRHVLRAQRIGVDEEADIALLKVSLPLPIQPLLGSSAALRAGDWVIAIGEPYGLDRAVAAGVVGGGYRHFSDDAEALFIQSDLALNPGNSGGPLVDRHGAIVGLNARLVAGEYGTSGLALSVPIEVVLQIAAELKAGGTVARPRLGVRYDDLDAPEALLAGRPYASGAWIREVLPGSLGERSGLRVGDLIVGMNGVPVGSGADLALQLLGWRSARGSHLTVFRAGHYRQLELP